VFHKSPGLTNHVLHLESDSFRHVKFYEQLIISCWQEFTLIVFLPAGKCSIFLSEGSNPQVKVFCEMGVASVHGFKDFPAKAGSKLPELRIKRV